MTIRDKCDNSMRDKEESFSPKTLKIHSEKWQEYLNQLKEFTGVHDINLLSKALTESQKNSGKFDLNAASNWLLEEGNTEVKENLPTPPPNSPNSKALVDLTVEPDDLAKAIQLSLEEGKSSVSREEQDVSRALEASLLEDGIHKRKRGDKWEDPLNPHDRKRVENWPVGLKNVGQTCWFSAVIQSLFHLPAFRSLVLHFSPKTESSCLYDEKTIKILEFMKELRILFGLLLGSERKYVDPSSAVEILKGVIGSSPQSLNNQQDVSEFTHMVLEWAELALKHDVRYGAQTTNPMTSLFYGQVITEGNNKGFPFCRNDTVGQWTLHVNDFADLHESLENSTALEYFDSESSDGQERWFVTLQPVLFFELSRFQFNQERKLAEKLHHPLEFPKSIYMDRYMAVNKSLTRSKREETKKLKEKREIYKNKLRKFTEFCGKNSGDSFSLASVLQAALDFAESSTPMEVDSSLSTETSDPSPRHVTPQELLVIQSTFSRWKKEVEEDVESLQASFSSLSHSIENMYNESSLQVFEYRLHAVMVHEGSLDSGHYWVYVYEPNRSSWLKFNDNSVVEASWEELVKESVGGTSRSSAYSLVYVSSSKPELFTPNFPETSSSSWTQTLSKDLADFVKRDNEAFQAELTSWDNEAPYSKTHSSEVSVLEEEKRTIVSSHAHLSLSLSLQFLQLVTSYDSEEWKSKDTFQILNFILQKTLSYYSAQLSSFSLENDVRLESFILYLLFNDANEKIIELGLLEQYSISALDHASSSPQGKALRSLSSLLLIQKRNQDPESSESISHFHEAYQTFRLSSHYFLSGLSNIINSEFFSSLKSLSLSYRLSLKLSASHPIYSSSNSKTLSLPFLSKYIRLSLLKVNDSLVKEFKLGGNEDLNDVVFKLKNTVVPLLATLGQRSENNFILEEIRSLWCSLLASDADMSSDSSTLIGDVLRIVLELPSSTNKDYFDFPKTAKHIHQKDDFELYSHYKDTLRQIKEVILEEEESVVTFN